MNTGRICRMALCGLVGICVIMIMIAPAGCVLYDKPPQTNSNSATQDAVDEVLQIMLDKIKCELDPAYCD